MFGNVGVGEYNCPKTTVGEVCSSIVRGPFGSALKKDFFVSRGPNTVKVYEQKHAIQKDWTLGTYYIDEEKFKELSRFECHGGDFIMSCSGTMGELYQLPDESELGIINQALCKFTLSNKMLPRFFTMAMSLIVQNLQSHGSAINNIAAVKYVKQMAIPLPDIDIQNEFVSFANQVDKSKVLMKKCFEKYDQLVKSRFIEMFGDPIENPKGWEKKKLRDLLLIERGGSPRPIDNYITEDENGLNWIKIGDAKEGSYYIDRVKEKIKPEGLKKTRVVEPGDLLLSNSMSFGKPYIMKIPGCIHDGWLVLRDLNNNFNKLFLCIALGLPSITQTFKRSARGAVVNNLNKDLVGALDFIVPPKELQNKFVEFVQQVDKSKFIITSKWTISRICCVH